MWRKLSSAALDELVTESRQIARRRKNLNLHQHSDETVQKLFIAMQADSYVRPHRHPEKEKIELFIAVRGRFAILLFDDQGGVQSLLEIGPGLADFGAEILPGTWHTVIALEDDSVFFEVKQGPYTPLSDKDFAPWAPPEGTPQTEQYLQWLHQAGPGDPSPSF
ncbi:MAG: WbuC family cupin fold metalloprotein [Gammaproteobacteria bacterium]|nr:WbuC family cupin fold metalloprotein [Gammaproteobacteria bacterium]MDH5651731.1 WbuC family cupin fold metalloprotein [Gammaproteobacteria bacterium]